MILVDTSAWVEFFRATRSPAAIEVRRLLGEQVGDVVICEPIAMEILAGATDATYPKLERLVNGSRRHRSLPRHAAYRPHRPQPQ